jgi:hypothetical protein
LGDDCGIVATGIRVKRAETEAESGTMPTTVVQ